MSINKINNVAASLISKVNGVSTSLIKNVNGISRLNIPGNTWTNTFAAGGEPNYVGCAYGYNTSLAKHIFCIISDTVLTNKSIYSSYDSTPQALGAGLPIFSYRTTPSMSTNWSGIVFGNNLFVAFSQTGSGSAAVMTSPDGITWTMQTITSGVSITSIAFGNGKFVALTNNSLTKIIYSTDGITWTSGGAPADISPGTIISFSNGYFATSKISTAIINLSTDGITWTTWDCGISANLLAIHYFNSEYLIFTSATSVLGHSPNLSSITNTTLPNNGYRIMQSLQGIGGYTNVAAMIKTSGTIGSGQTNIITSLNGSTWSYKNNNSSNLRDLTSGAGAFLAIGQNFILFSNN